MLDDWPAWAFFTVAGVAGFLLWTMDRWWPAPPKVTPADPIEDTITSDQALLIIRETRGYRWLGLRPSQRRAARILADFEREMPNEVSSERVRPDELESLGYTSRLTWKTTRRGGFFVHQLHDHRSSRPALRATGGGADSRHSSTFFPLSRYGLAGSSTMARNADRAVPYELM